MAKLVDSFLGILASARAAGFAGHAARATLVVAGNIETRLALMVDDPPRPCKVEDVRQVRIGSTPAKDSAETAASGVCCATRVLAAAGETHREENGGLRARIVVTATAMAHGYQAVYSWAGCFSRRSATARSSSSGSATARYFTAAERGRRCGVFVAARPRSPVPATSWLDDPQGRGLAGLLTAC
jgi:hypothetical protein